MALVPTYFNTLGLYLLNNTESYTILFFKVALRLFNQISGNIVSNGLQVINISTVFWIKV